MAYWHPVLVGQISNAESRWKILAYMLVHTLDPALQILVFFFVQLENFCSK